MSEIEQALERLGNAVDKLQDKLARSTPAAANLGSAPSEETVSVANPINFDELHIIIFWFSLSYLITYCRMQLLCCTQIVLQM